MFGRISALCVALLAMLVILHTGSPAAAEEMVWRVSKSSGEVSVTTSAGEQSALIAGATLKPGDNVRTGQNGRVLLMRGEETMLISPNSAIGIPKARKEGMATSIIQQSGSILLEVEKRNVKHFEVETPYLAAVVKGTQFRVTVENGVSRVDVLRGQVEVTDLKSGQYAMVWPSQAAEATAQGTAGLSLSGAGTLSPIQQGTPRRASVMPLPEASAVPAVKSEGSAESKSVRTASLLNDTDAQWLRSSRPSTTDSGWSFSSPGSLFGNSHGRRSRNEDIAMALAFSIAIGAGVALMVSAQRRRKNRKTLQG